ncbi:MULTISPECIES: DUF2937 family protein [unclassified Agarivorans]|uniref:DUF2937 family protein n=1 Tax=unclassified Agarivorans TaxID=2636026 RepID=UPI0026E41438|nr:MULTISPECIES: DUF2937 family protein [unclassified Agarivorans]MDO6685222.1 DUF2937 family protein [Agarivorans sp. 3_MG-2023]MDO6715606.1 DUF2937 family protein [Agarivorans sp. 2_MG-2023]
MLVNTLDKVVFAILLLSFMQLPPLSNHYLQFVSGQLDALQQQVDSYQQNAELHKYPSIQKMIDDFKKNPNLAVRTDAEQKQQTMYEYQELSNAISVFEQGTYYQKAKYMFSPQRWETLEKVLKNFKPGISIEPVLLAYSGVAALLFGGMIMWPLRRAERAFKP